MKKNYFLVMISFSSLFFAGCQPTPEVIETSDALIVESTPIDQEELTGVLLIQEEARSFPQNQGVFDFNHGELTIVKQYIPDTYDKDYLTIKEIDMDPIQKDFEKTFPNKTWNGDPYMVYQETFSPITLVITEETVELTGENFEKTFSFEDSDKQHVYDENNVLYSIQYDK